MIVEYSKDFERTVRKLSKRLESVRNVILEVKNARNLADITDCIKMQDYDYIYRIHVGNYRAFFNFHVGLLCDFVNNCYTRIYTIFSKLKGTKKCIRAKW